MPELWKCDILYKHLCLESPLCRHPGDLPFPLRAALSLSSRAQKRQTLSTLSLPHSPALSPALVLLKDSCRRSSDKYGQAAAKEVVACTVCPVCACVCHKTGAFLRVSPSPTQAPVGRGQLLPFSVSWLLRMEKEARTVATQRS